MVFMAMGGLGALPQFRVSNRFWAGSVCLLVAFFVEGPSRAQAARPVATIAAARGSVQVRGPGAKKYGPAKAGMGLSGGTRLKTGPGGDARLKFFDGTVSKVRSETEIVVRARQGQRQSTIVLFFGRIWTRVVSTVRGERKFEVHSANAVAGVRGTVFEVGVAEDGSTRVVVEEGEVKVDGDRGERSAAVPQGYEVQSTSQGALEARKKTPQDPGWVEWLQKRARKLEKEGLKVARDLDGRLARRRAKVERLVKTQKRLRREIEALGRAPGPSRDKTLRAKLKELERVTARLLDMRARLESAFGLFARWGTLHERGRFSKTEGKQVKAIVKSIAKIAADFADMIEEGTDLSEEGMDEMMEEMQKGGTLRPSKSAKDELF